MSVLFSSQTAGSIELPNRFVCSATYEAMAGENGEVSEELVKRYTTLAKGEVGLSITGLLYVEPSGRGYRFQAGIHNDRMLDGLGRLAEAVHQHGGKIAFQLAHCGRQTTRQMAGQRPMAPSARGRDPVNFVKPRMMTESDIGQTIEAFGQAARRAAEAGADAVQLHAAHGYLISEFLSPFFNTRADAWGGTDRKRFRFLEAIYAEVTANVPQGFPIYVKLNTNDCTPQEGITPALAVTYAGWLSALGVDAVEVSCGTTNYSYMNMCRGDVPTKEIVKSLSWWQKPVGSYMIGKLEGKYPMQEGYNLHAAERMRPALTSTRLMVVGGMRSVGYMEMAVASGAADFISMSRPFIRDPFLVKKIREKKIDRVSCVSCNRCFAAVPNEIPVYCYNKTFPQ